MAFKINISNKGKTFHVDSENEGFVGKELHDKIQGLEISPDLSGWEFEITGASDKAGFPLVENVEGIGLKKLLLSYEKGMKKRPKKEGKKKRSKLKPKGLRLRKTVRGKVISGDVVQINLKVLKNGSKNLEEVFAEQANKEKKLNRKERRKQKPKKEEAKPVEAPTH